LNLIFFSLNVENKRIFSEKYLLIKNNYSNWIVHTLFLTNFQLSFNGFHYNNREK
jgi:hypothetical protein